MRSKKIKLTQAEIYYLHRRRDGQSQSVWARCHGMTRNRLSSIERGLIKAPLKYRITAVTVAEKCLILRHRAKDTQAEVAWDMGVSRFWVNQMEHERAPIAALRKYWGV